MTIYRLSGIAQRVVSREVKGKERNEDGTYPSYTFTSQEVEVAPLLLTKLDLEDGDNGLPEGEYVDIAVEVVVSRGYQRATIRGAWPDQSAQKAAASKHVARPAA